MMTNMYQRMSVIDDDTSIASHQVLRAIFFYFL